MTDLLPAISRAINLATRLRALSDKKVKDAEFKGILDDILLELAEVQLKVEEVMNENVILKGQVQNPKGELCPRCGELGWRVTGSRPHGQHGSIARTYSCPKCGLKEEVIAPAK
jgi:predicted RNA-binding Zn-ribbon protein involved in translation (DUF1610 family)